jgi:peptidoglycan/LPS O-acetylase OafA/YrhL
VKRDAGLSRSSAPEAQRRRSIYLDALRAVALTRVVVYHAVGHDWITLFTAMPLMFFIAGSLFAGSVDRRPARQVVLDRYRRILLPYWAYAAGMIVLWGLLGVLGELAIVDWVGFAFPVLSPNGPQGPGEGTVLELTWVALWYLQFHLILSVLGPWLRRVQQRRARATWATLGGIFVVGWAAGSGIVVVVFYIGCWVLGYHQHDGDLEAPVRQWWRLICAVAGPVGAVLFVAYEGSAEWSLTSARLALVGAALLGAFWLTLAIALRPHLEPRMAKDWVRSLVHWFSQRSLTVYMWHLVAIYAARELALPGTPTWAAVLAWCVPLTVAAVVAVGWVEDLAARRSATLWPRLPSAVQ